MSQLSKDIPLKCAPNLDLKIRSYGDVRIATENGAYYDGGIELVSIAEVFSHPTSMKEGLKQLRDKIRFGADFIYISSLLVELTKRGILEREGESAPLGRGINQYDSAPVHVRMLNDLARTKAFQDALRKRVRPGDVVLEIGAGTGVLSVTAALAGAKHVYAFEESPIARLARQIFEANGVADRITLIDGRSTQCDLPERADLLVAELIGNDPLCESILPVTADAIARHLKPGATLIPDGLNVFALPVEIPAHRLESHLVTPALAQRWQQELGIDFAPFLDACRSRNHEFDERMQHVQEWTALAEPIHLLEIDLHQSAEAPTSAVRAMTAARDGEISGIVVYFDTNLCEGVRLSLAPGEVSPTNCWGSRIWIPASPIAVKAGEKIQLSYHFGATGSAFEVNRVAA